MSALLHVEHLDAGYGDLTVVRDLSIEVDAGEVVCLLGANGAGKTTSLLTLAGVLSPLGGQVRFKGELLPGEAHQVARRGLCLVPQDRGIFHQLTVAENLRLRAHRQSQVGVDDVVAHFPALGDLQNRRAGLLSGGEQQMLALGSALISDPKLLMVDEMSLGLAPIIVERLLPLVRDIARSTGMGVLLVEQQVSAALAVSDRGAVMQRGSIVASGTADELLDAAQTLEASYLGPEGDGSHHQASGGERHVGT